MPWQKKRYGHMLLTKPLSFDSSRLAGFLGVVSGERGSIFRTGKSMPAYAGMRGWPRATIRYQTRIATHTDHLRLKASQFCIEIIAQKSQTERLTTLE